MKCFADGPQDLLDAKDAYLGAEGPVDLDLMRRITRRFGRDAADRLEGMFAQLTLESLQGTSDADTGKSRGGK
jgi:hypothetical protein